jgi:hypothetical protein
VLFRSNRLKQWLKHTFSSTWINENIPNEWFKGIICPLHNKGKQLECAKYTGITLLNVTYKVFSNILYARLLPHTESKLGCYQAGFRPRKLTIVLIFVLQQVLENMKEFGTSSHLLFIDFKSAYDSTDKERMYEAMNELNIPEKLIRLVKRIMSNMHSQIKIQLNLSAPFIIHKGVQQGDVLNQT